MLKLRELEEYLGLGVFDYPSYIEMHSGPHEFCLYDKYYKKGDEPENKMLDWVKFGNRFYSITPSCFGNNNVEDTWSNQYGLPKEGYNVEELCIRVRGEKVKYTGKLARRYGYDWYWSNEQLFKGTIDSLGDLKRLFKQLGIKKDV